MADVFISHSERDRDVADQLAAFLLGIGRSVWWDPDPPSGIDMRTVRAAELAVARVVIVLWSKSAFISPFVLHEAIAAREANKVLHVKTDDIRTREFSRFVVRESRCSTPRILLRLRLRSRRISVRRAALRSAREAWPAVPAASHC